MKKFEWKGCSNLNFPYISTGIMEIKRKYVSERYKGKGRPKKSDYDCKSLKDIMFEIDEIFNKQIEHLYLSGKIILPRQFA